MCAGGPCGSGVTFRVGSSLRCFCPAGEGSIIGWNSAIYCGGGGFCDLWTPAYCDIAVEDDVIGNASDSKGGGGESDGWLRGSE